jgi:hypothetical protein
LLALNSSAIRYEARCEVFLGARWRFNSLDKGFTEVAYAKNDTTTGGFHNSIQRV